VDDLLRSEPLRIAFFTDSFVPTHDGVALVTDTLARALLRAGHSVTVFTVRPPALPRWERRSDGLGIRRYRSVAAPRYPQYRIAIAPWTVLLPRRGDFDVVHVHTPGFVGLAGWMAGRRWRVPTVATYHTDLTGMLRGSGSNPLSRAFYRGWSRFSVDLCRHSDLATAPSDAARDGLGSTDRGPPRVETRRVPNGVDTERFRPGIRSPDWRERLNARDAVVITFLGRLTRDKGVGRFLDALERIDTPRPWLAVVAGEGPERPVVEARLRGAPALARRARFIGRVAEAEKPALLSQTSIFVLPSLSDTSSIALLEAMASGASCVVTRFGGPGEIAQRSSAGLLTDPREPAQLAGAIGRLLTDRETARSLAERGREWVRAEASADRMAREYVACYRDAMDRPVPKRG